MGILKALGKSVGGTPMNPLGVGLAAGQMVSGMIKRKKADAQLPAAEDPMMRQALSGLQAKSRQLETGTANNADRVAARQMAKTMASSSFKTGGKANMGAQSAAISQALGNINAQNREQAVAMAQMATAQANEMAQRKSDINMLRSERTSASAENQVSAGQDNLLASVGVGGKNEEGSAFTKLSSLLKKKKAGKGLIGGITGMLNKE
jgi:hypothetical protein